ncbi:hypothetical protein G6011_11260 [Alternaria panax]|uniref:Uncharacterized protein n=1 Tax=Alternaria panax TaxID=48097 RepID=A0AAD4IDP3_9PLEO|nr:hypothetical protein G6011_11260 [Alternaria panax]
MSDSTAGDSASALYQSLRGTALSFIEAQAVDQSCPERMNFALLRTHCTSSFQHSWGHNYAVSVTPPLQGTHSFDDFVKHLNFMLPKLESWKADVTNIIVDPVAMKVMLRISFWMQAKGAKEADAVENDLLWELEMEGVGEGKVKIKRSIEFVDGAASRRLREVVMGMAKG